MTLDLEATFGTDSPVVGMVHLPALPGAPGYDSAGDGTDGRERIRERALRDARALVRGGVDGLLVENYGDAPFYPEEVPRHVVADVTALAGAVTDAVDCPVGVQVLRNDAPAGVAVAAATGARFVRVNVHAGAAVTDQGVIEGRAHETLRLRERIDADVAVLADVGVKHAAPLADRGVETEVREATERAGADGVLVSGPATGEPAPTDRVRRASEAAAADVPVFVASGVTADSVARYLELADGVVVGTALKRDGVTTNPVDPDRVSSLVAAADREP